MAPTPGVTPLPRVLPGSWLLLPIAVLAVRLLATVPFALYDDAFITLRYAENLAAGHGFVYAPGAPWEPVLGTTTPGYTCILAVAAWCGVPLPIVGVLFNSVCDAAILALLLKRGLVTSPFGGIVAAALFVNLPHLARISAGGMEAPVFVLAAVAALDRSWAGRPVAAAALGVLAGIVRPEGVLVLAVNATVLMRQPRALGRYLLTAVPLGLAYLAALTAYFGSPLPQSVIAKAGEHGAAAERIVEILRESFAPHPILLAALPLVLVGAVASLRLHGTWRAYTSFVLLLTAAYLVARPKFWGWYAYPALTAWCGWCELGLAAGASCWPRAMDRLRRWTGGSWSWPLVCSGAVLYWLFLAYVIGPSAVRTRVYAPMRAWARATPLTPNTRILAYDVGALGYYTRACILDMAGLVWPAPVGKQSIAQLVRAYEPEYILLTVAQANLASVQGDPEFAPEYVALHRFSVTGAQQLEIDPQSVGNAWRQDYVLYQRCGAVAGRQGV